MTTAGAPELAQGQAALDRGGHPVRPPDLEGRLLCRAALIPHPEVHHPRPGARLPERELAQGRGKAIS